LILDFVQSTGYFRLAVPRSDAQLVQAIVKRDGWDFSIPASTNSTAVLITKEPYAAAAYGKYATQQARGQLRSILAAIEDSWRNTSDRTIRCPVDKELWPFQRASVAYALGRQNTLVGDQPGLGKTPIAICYANEIRAKRVLVICPANIRLQWVRRIREWTTLPWPYVVYPILSGRHGVHPQASWTVVSYDLARTETIGRALAQGTYDLLILDEAHYLKSVDAGRTHAVFGDHTGNMRRYNKETKHHETLFEALAARCGSVLALTGTPLPNRPREAYTLARGLCFDAIDWMSEDRFKERFNPSARFTGERADGTPYTYTREEVGRHGELQNRLRANFMVRHLMTDPEIKQQIRYSGIPRWDLVLADETKPVREALQAEGMLDIDPERFECESIEVQGQWAQIRHQMGLAIAPQVAEYAAMCIDGGEEKLLIGAWHVSVLNALQEKLERFGVVRIDGSTSVVQREERVKDFVENPGTRIMLGNMMAMGIGVDDLQKVCQHALIAEPDPVPGMNEQFVGRLDRIGQSGTVQADLFVAPGSLLERILAKSLQKRRNTHAALDARVA
jgi:SWI/SNF-related matrix-associated actin-dependent regulator 1 of chromatin subfamily A